MLLDLRSLVEAPAATGGGSGGRDVTPEQLRRIQRHARSLVPAIGPYLHPRQAGRRKPAPVPARFDPKVALVLYELGEIDELELTALLSEVTTP